MQPSFLFLLAAFATGAWVTTYLALNAYVSAKVGSDIQASLPYFLFALLTTLLIFTWKDSWASISKFSEVPWWAFLAGFGGGFGLWATTLLISRIGPDQYFVASVAGQLLLAVLLSHYAWLGTEQDPISWQKVLGVLMAIGGAALVSFGGK
jgi:transporter family-2 protein